LTKVDEKDKKIVIIPKKMYFNIEVFFENKGVSMKTAFFVVLLTISVTFLSCGTNENNAYCVKAAKKSYEDIDPSCNSEQRKLVVFIDLSPKEIDWDYVYSHLLGYVPGSGVISEYGSVNSLGYVYHNVNGIEMTQEEYEAYKGEYWRKYEEELNKSERYLQIPCIVGGGIALLTDEEIAELMKIYDGLAIENYLEVVPMLGSDIAENTAGTHCGE